MDGFATVDGTLAVHQPGGPLLSLFDSGTLSPSDGDRAAGLISFPYTGTITFAEPVSEFGAYWASPTSAGIEFAPDPGTIVVTFRNSEGASVGTTSLLYSHTGAHDGLMDWHGWAFSEPVKYVDIDGYYQVMIDGLQAGLSGPDTDGDGVPDGDDFCPDDPGLPELGGCPDTDGDGIADPQDGCPGAPGLPEFNGCPDPDARYVYACFGGHMYTLTQFSGSSLAARIEAKNLGGDLVSINDAAEEAFLEDTYSELSENAFWIGLHSEGPWGNWAWYDGDPVTYTKWGNWGVQEPNNATPGQTESAVILYLYAPYGWGDVIPNRSHQGIVEIDLLDTDCDGVADRDDVCPSDPGLAEFDGCPDADGDGIPDWLDRCPTEPGLLEFDGCPDSDGDGIPDPDDLCPSLPGPLATGGCPDADGDGVANGDDDCPESILTATVWVGGCDTGVANPVGANGCSLADRIAAALRVAAAGAKNHGKFVSAMAEYLNGLVGAGTIDWLQHEAIMRCIGPADHTQFLP